MSVLVAALLVLAVLLAQDWSPHLALWARPAGSADALSPPPLARVRRRLVRGRDRTAAALAILGLVEAIAPALEAGLTPATALTVAASGAPSTGNDQQLEVGRWAGYAAAAAGCGEPVAPLWRRGASRLGSPELQLLAAAWALSEVTGGPLADAARTTAGMVRAQIAQERRVAMATAGARATMNVLALLPLGGPLVALALGIDPAALYLHTPVAEVALVSGLVLTCVGRWWVRRLVSVAVRGTASA